MRRKAWATLAWAIVLAAALHAHAADISAPPIVAQGTLQAAFAPWDKLEKLIANAIGGARKQVLVQAYLITSKKIANTLTQARRRGIDVRVLADAEQIGKAATSRVPDLAAAGIAVWLETKYQNAHNKVIVIDADTPLRRSLPAATISHGPHSTRMRKMS